MSDETDTRPATDAASARSPFRRKCRCLPLRDTVLFPNSFMPLAVARESSVKLIDEAIAGGKLIGVFTQKRSDARKSPARPICIAIGTLTHIHKMFKLPDGSLRLIVQGLARIRLDAHVGDAAVPARRSRAKRPTCSRDGDALEIDALQRNIRANFQQVVQLSPVLSDDLTALAANITRCRAGWPTSSRRASARSARPSSRSCSRRSTCARGMDELNRILTKELEVLELGSKIQSQVQSEVGKNQREYFLREQMKAIQKELGEGDDQAKEIDELREKIEAAGMPDDVKKEALRELDRLSKMPAAAAEYTVARTYIDWLVALPWAKRTDEVIDLVKHQAGARRRSLRPRAR